MWDLERLELFSKARHSKCLIFQSFALTLIRLFSFVEIIKIYYDPVIESPNGNGRIRNFSDVSFEP